MSKQSSKKPAGAVEELDEALEALPDDETNGEDAAEEDPLTQNDNPLEHVDVSGTTSFESAEFAAEYEGRAPGGVEEHEEGAFVIHDADAEDRAEELARRRAEAKAAGEGDASEDEVAPGGQPRELAELMSVCEALIFVSDEPLPLKALADLLGEEKGWVRVAVEELAKEFNERGGGLMLRELAGGWQFATRPEHHEHIRAYLKSKPSAKLSLAALETLAVIAYKQPVTVPEILEIRGVQSSSAIKTLLDKRLIIAKGRKETVGRPMMYGTSKEFLLQFGLKDLSELPNVEDFEDLAGGGGT
ncbi:MAG TPA: SMC-Scp complex subunit ScpB [Pyrinomonadaceae bacterium]|nr:SMC-Scp complex subunit ScpB [Pyrinomonadaceae bacterium]